MSLTSTLQAIGRGSQTVARRIKNHRTDRKVPVDAYVDPILFWVAANSAYLWLGNQALDFVSHNIDSNKSLAMFGTYAVLATGLYTANKIGILPAAKRIRKIHRNRAISGVVENTALSFGRTGAQLATLIVLYGMLNFPQALANYQADGERILYAFERPTKGSTEEVEQAINKTPASLEKLIPKTIDPKKVTETSKYTEQGRFLRAYRWHNIFTKLEREYPIEPGLLAGLAMRESYGNPLELNESGDGGAGLFMFQPGTAKQFGLKTYGNSNASGRDRNHGLKLARLVQDEGWNYERLSRMDERFDVEKSGEAATQFLVQLHEKYGSWDKALSGYNRGTPHPNPELTDHVIMTRRYQKFYLRTVQELKP